MRYSPCEPTIRIPGFVLKLDSSVDPCHWNLYQENPQDLEIEEIQRRYHVSTRFSGDEPPLGSSPSRRVHRWVASIPISKGYRLRWVVFSKGKRLRTLEYIFLKWLYDELEIKEIVFLLDTPEFHNSNFMIACFRIANEFGKRILRRRLEELQFLIPTPFVVSRRKYVSMKSLGVSISLEISQTKPPPKYTGWVRHLPVAHGGRGIPVWGNSDLFEPEIGDVNIWIDLLSSVDPVGLLFRSAGRGPDEAFKRPKRKSRRRNH